MDYGRSPGRSDFISGIVNEALDFAQLEAFIHGASNTTQVNTGNGINVALQTQSHLPESPPDSGSEPPYSPADLHTLTLNGGTGSITINTGENHQHHPHQHHHNSNHNQGNNNNGNQNSTNTSNGNDIQQQQRQQLGHHQMETHQVNDLHGNQHLINNSIYLTSSSGNNDNQPNNNNQQQSNGNVQQIILQQNSSLLDLEHHNRNYRNNILELGGGGVSGNGGGNGCGHSPSQSSSNNSNNNVQHNQIHPEDISRIIPDVYSQSHPQQQQHQSNVHNTHPLINTRKRKLSTPQIEAIIKPEPGREISDQMGHFHADHTDLMFCQEQQNVSSVPASALSPICNVIMEPQSPSTPTVNLGLTSQSIDTLTNQNSMDSTCGSGASGSGVGQQQGNESDPCPLQCIRFNPFQQQNWNVLCDQSLQELPIPHYRVDADKGFNFSNSDDAFVCQKKNHFQITCHAQLQGSDVFVRTPTGFEKVRSFHLHFYGVKLEAPTHTIRVEQSQSDRSKKPFHPVPIDLQNCEVSKVTVGRLHFSETTSNNMRKKGRPNPEQRYFQLVVGLHAHTHSGHFPIVSHGSERIIVRASNPGQFESDVELTWQRGVTQESIYHAGRVGINTDRPDESLVVHGNLKISGHIVHPSDSRAKQEIAELDTEKQLKNVQQIRVVQYRYEPEFAVHSGLSNSRDNNVFDTGVIAQEVQKILPDAVQETGSLRLPNGQIIENFLVVNKERIFMENIGAVKELCKVTGSLETRIEQLERINSRLARIQKLERLNRECQVGGNKCKYHRKTCNYFNSNEFDEDETADVQCSNKMIQLIIIILVMIMAICLAAISTLYFVEHHKQEIQFESQLDNDLSVSYTKSLPQNSDYISAVRTTPGKQNPLTKSALYLTTHTPVMKKQPLMTTRTLQQQQIISNVVGHKKLKSTQLGHRNNNEENETKQQEKDGASDERNTIEATADSENIQVEIDSNSIDGILQSDNKNNDSNKYGPEDRLVARTDIKSTNELQQLQDANDRNIVDPEENFQLKTIRIPTFGDPPQCRTENSHIDNHECPSACCDDSANKNLEEVPVAIENTDFEYNSNSDLTHSSLNSSMSILFDTESIHNPISSSSIAAATSTNIGGDSMASVITNDHIINHATFALHDERPVEVKDDGNSSTDRILNESILQNDPIKTHNYYTAGGGNGGGGSSGVIAAIDKLPSHSIACFNVELKLETRFFNQTCEPQTICRTDDTTLNVSYLLPISKYMQDTEIVLHFSSLELSEWFLCPRKYKNNNKGYRHDYDNQRLAEDTQDAKFYNKNSPRSSFTITLPVNGNFEQYLEFRTPLDAAKKNICQLPSNRLGQFIQYNFKLFRDCD